MKKNKTLKPLFIGTSAALLLLTGIAIPLVSCSASDKYQVYELPTFPSLLDNTNNEQRTQLMSIINKGPNFKDELDAPKAESNYANCNVYILRVLANALYNSKIKVADEYNPKNNFIANMEYSNDNQFLVIKAQLLGKHYAFYCPRAKGDPYYGGDNQASVDNVKANQWANLLAFNSTQLSQQYLNNLYQQLGININISNGRLSPWLTHGYYDGINQQAVFDLYGYDANETFNYQTATFVCQVGISSNTVSRLSAVNPNIGEQSLVLNTNANNISYWTKNNSLKLIPILNLFTSVTADATNNMVGNDQQIFNSIETNLSKLMQALGHATPSKAQQQTMKNVAQEFDALKAKPLPNLVPESVHNFMNQLIKLCQDPKTYQIYNQIMSDVNSILDYNNFNHYISLANLNRSIEEAIDTNNPSLISRNFAGLVTIFNGFDFSDKASDASFEGKLWNQFINNEFNALGLKLGTQIANQWLMFASPSNIYFENNIVMNRDIMANPTRNITGNFYLKIVNNTTTTQSLSLFGKTYKVPVNKAFNLYLNLNGAQFLPYVYQDNNQYKFGIKIKQPNGTNASTCQVGVFDKNATGIQNKSSFSKLVWKDNSLCFPTMSAIGTQVENVKEVTKSTVTNVQQINPIDPDKLNQKIGETLQSIFQNNYTDAIDNLAQIQILTKTFQTNSNTVLQALDISAPAIKTLVVNLVKALANGLTTSGSLITHIIDIVQALSPSLQLPAIFSTLNNLFPQLNQMINYVPHYYVTLNDGDTVDILGTFTGDLKHPKYKPNTQPVLTFLGNIIEGLFTCYQKDANGKPDLNQPYTIWQFAHDHINDLMAIICSLTPIMNMIPDGVTNFPITNSDQWKPGYTNNKVSPLDTFIPLIISNFYNMETGQPIDVAGVKNIIAGLGSIVPTIQGLITNGAYIPPAGADLICTLIRNLAATAADAKSQTSLLGFVSNNGNLISQVLTIVNPDIGKIIGAVFETFTGNPDNYNGFLDVTIGQLNGTQPSSGSGGSSGGATWAKIPGLKPKPDKPTNPPADQTPPTPAPTPAPGFWDKLGTNLAGTGNPTLKTVGTVIKIVGPIVSKLLTAISNPLNDKGQPADFNYVKESLHITFDKSKQQVTLSFLNPVYFDVSSLVGILNELIDKFTGKLAPIIKPLLPIKENNILKGKYCIVLNETTPIVYNLYGVNPSYSIQGNKYELSGISAKINYQDSHIGNILDFLNINNLIGSIKSIYDLFGSSIPSNFKPLVDFVFDLLTIDKSQPGPLFYFAFNFLLPNFGIFGNIDLGQTTPSKLTQNPNEIDPFNYVNVKKTVFNKVGLSKDNLAPQAIMNYLNTQKIFGASVMTNLKASKIIVNQSTNQNTYVMTSLIPLIAIDGNGNKTKIKGLKLDLVPSADDSQIDKITITPLYADSTLTAFTRNIVANMLSSNFMEKDPTDPTKVQLTSFGTAFAQFLDKYLNSPVVTELDKQVGALKQLTIQNDTHFIKPYNDQESPDSIPANPDDKLPLSALNTNIWGNPEENVQNYQPFVALVGNKNVNNFIVIQSISKPTNKRKKWSQTITFEIPAALNIDTSKPRREKIVINYGSQEPKTPVEITNNNKYQALQPVTPISESAPQLMNALYTVLSNPSGMAFEENSAKILSAAVVFLNSCLGYGTPLYSVAPIMSKPEIAAIIDKLIPLLIKNANNESWWIALEGVIKLLI